MCFVFKTEITCQQLPDAPLNGFISKSPTNPIYGSVLSFACDDGYFPIGSLESECGDTDEDGNGDWITRNLTCRSK